ncbi:cyclic nucleotide-binding domain-containing protein 2-like [Stylophora pistillata]|uniref:cyclic nucleotide-binding domain-containing protein 2-like n=1 Tax=Stylophora pistillata TaxID=50429 RepID=UPI000C05720A|nr:cyclic nucleotide-binding domain-containing protein 2-like [Stylophora pistillata]
MQRRVELLKEHHVFSTWPSDVVKQVAEESILQDYNSDEVIIRDSSKMQRIVFVTKGQCNVLRLLDLSNCKEYIDHALKYRVEKIKEDGSTIYNPDVEDISLSSVVLRRFPPRVKSPEENSSAASSENKIRKKVKSAPPYTNSGLHQPIMTVSQPVKGILHSESARGKSLRSRVSFQDENRELPGVEKELLQPSESPPRSPKPSGMLHQMNGPEEGFREKHAEGENVGVGVYMMVDRLRPGQCFGAWSLLEQEDQFLPKAEKASPPSQQNERDLHSHKKKSFKRQTKENKPRDRRFTLVSAGCEVVKVAKEVFFKYSDAETLDKLKRLTTNYPKDSFLCQTYLQQSDWRTYRENVVDNVVVRHIARLETAKGSARSHKVRSSQVPSPLGSVKMWPSVNSRWEYFPEEGWVSVQVTKPIVAAGTSRPHSSDYSAVNSRSRCQSPSSRKQSAHDTPRGSPVPLPSPTSKSSEKLLPLVKNDLVLAQGSQRTLVLTHGGSRSNNYQLKIERRIIDKHESRINNPLVNKVK